MQICFVYSTSKVSLVYAIEPILISSLPVGITIYA